MLYIIPNYYQPSIAATNRFLALLRALSKQYTRQIKVCFFLPDEYRSKVEDTFDKNVEFIYYWENYFFRSKYLKYVSYFLCTGRFRRQLRAGDVVLLLGQVDLISRLYDVYGVRVYHERTEYPELWPIGNRFHTIPPSKYWEYCSKISGMFVISTSLRDYFVSHGVKSDNVLIYNMIVDSSRFMHLEKEEKDKYIAYCGTIGDFKDGVNLLLTSFKKVSESHPDIKLYIIGRKPANLTRYMACLQEMGLEQKVVFTGLVDYKNMPQMLKNAEMLVLERPDNIQAKYGFPTKLGEYLLTGNPVVVTSVGDIPLFLKDGENAMLSRPNNVDDFAGKMEWVLNHPAEAKEIGERGKQTALSVFSPEVEAKKILHFIKL